MHCFPEIGSSEESSFRYREVSEQKGGMSGIARSRTSTRPVVGRLSAAKLFTDRDDQRELIKNFFERLARVGVRPEKPVLSFWGVGGRGKTSLFLKAIEELGQTNPDLRLIYLDIDSDSWRPTSPVADLLWHLRCKLAEPELEHRGSKRFAPGRRGIERTALRRRAKFRPPISFGFGLHNYLRSWRAVRPFRLG